ncbi:MAG: serine O-acetyltransferase [Carnobacterium sp.]|uniref:serine O-acetyltransferase n=1 Tax=Carnobacterium sp. TaxID=48221 RepID=UPI002649A521|nr:hypothetical protein [Carnobacterium sp.]MDN5372950.1 serine O-acetyltransferase [Carnobacterium sp.]
MSLIADFKYYDKSNLRIVYEIFFDNNTSAVFLFRLSSWFNHHHMKVFAHLFSMLNTTLNGCQISYDAKIGVGFKIYHSVGIVLGNTIAGNEFTLYQNVTVGMNHRVNDNGQDTPIFGDNVSIYSGAVVVGPITIGNHVRIGANTVVLKDVPNHTTVIGTKPTYI